MPAAKATRLVIVESPAKAKTIGRFLDDRYQVEASYGHVRDLPQNAKEIPAAVRGEEWARLGVDVERGYAPLYVVPAEKKKHVKRLQEALKGAEQLLLATDEDREGESISWHVLELLSPPKSMPVSRIVFHEVTQEAIAAALEHPRGVDEKLVRAQEARRVLDRLYGYTLSPLLWKRVAPGLSAGRVQSVAVRLAVERERERIAFRASEYWDLAVELAAPGGGFTARLVRLGGRRLADAKSFDPATGRLADGARLHLDGEAARGYASAAEEARPWRVTSLERTPGTQRPAPPFTTSTLQQEANRKLRLTAQRTMRIAQQLYEGVDLGGERVGLITYMRTDSVALADRAVAQARRVIAAAYGADYLPERPLHYRTKAKRAQEAHEAIRPTDLSRRPQDVARHLSPEQAKLYELIWKRTVACQMLPARFERTAVEVTVEVGGEGRAAEPLAFAASGRRIVFPGFLRAYVEGSDDPEAELGDQETLLPALAEGQDLEPVRVAAEGHETRPPMRYTEASLVKRLEEEGIGRPSTYATILSTIQDRGYVFKRGNELVPTFTAFCVTELLEESFADLVDTEFTARMEDELDEVAAGEREWVELVASFYRGNGGGPGLLSRLENLELRYPAVDVGADPASGEPLRVKIGRYGPYVVRGEGGKGNTASLPDNLPPDELTVERALMLLNGKADAAEPLASDPATGRPITAQLGRFGPYLELGLEEAEREAGAKPKRVSLPRGMDPEAVTPEVAVKLMSLPRTVGRHPASGEEISAGLGRYGPYLRHGDEFRNLPSWEAACDLTLDEALAILAAPKPQSRGRRGGKPEVIRELGEVAGAAGPVKLLAGRYGPYVSDGEVNASLPRGADPGALTAAEAAELLAKRRAAGPAKKPRRRRKS
jgi:DNA topoisomerase I